MTVTLSRRALAGILLAIGVVVLAIGLFLGFGNVSQEGTPCGSPFRPDDGTALIPEFSTAPADASRTYTVSTLRPMVDDCTKATDRRRPIAWATTIAGGVIASAGLLLLLLPTTARRSDRP